MASTRTALTELATAVGLVWEPDLPWPTSVETAEVPGIEHDRWWPVLAPAVATGGRDRDLLLAALANGRAFRLQVLDRPPRHVEWTGADKTVWPSEVPRDLTVDDVWFIQAKHDSTCVLNTSPAALLDDLLAETETRTRRSWYDEVATLELAAYYDAVRRATAPGDLPVDHGDLDHDHRQLLKKVMRGRDHPSADEEARYASLAAAVSERSAHRWQARLSRATQGQQARLVIRMLRIAGGPYWLLGSKGHEPLRLRVSDSRAWRERYQVRSLLAEPAGAGQPQVNWRAEIVDRATREADTVAGFCEIRWSHGKLQGNPECKVQVTTPLDALPGYDPMGGP